MNDVLRIIGNFPLGLTFNHLAELAAEHVSRSTLVKWLDQYEEYHVIERARVRRGQSRIIKPSGNYRNWLDVQENSEIAIGFYQREIRRLTAESARRKFNKDDYYSIYKLQNNICRLPFESYITGMGYSQQVANYLRDAVDKQVKLIYTQLETMMVYQSKQYSVDPFSIFHQLDAIVDLSVRLELLKSKANTRDETERFRLTLNTAKQRLDIMLYGPSPGK